MVCCLTIPHAATDIAVFMYVLCVRTRIVVAISATVSASRIEGLCCLFLCLFNDFIHWWSTFKVTSICLFNSIQMCIVSSCSAMLGHRVTHLDHCRSDYMHHCSMTNLHVNLLHSGRLYWCSLCSYESYKRCATQYYAPPNKLFVMQQACFMLTTGKSIYALTHVYGDAHEMQRLAF
jgi:hypothetical protein